MTNSECFEEKGHNQRDLIYGSNWDVLVILDACRYDVFRDVYTDILGDMGTLRKAISPATHTIEWLNKTFEDTYLDDTVYFSSNAFVNSQGIAPEHQGYTFDASEHFGRIIDVWKDAWDDELGTVHPGEMNKHAVAAMDFHRGKRFIIHYLQPHYPYIHFGGEEGEIHQVISADKGDGRSFNWRRWAGRLALRVLSEEDVWRLGKKLGVEPQWMLAKIWYKYGREGIIKGYREDLKLALRHVKKLLARYPTKHFVITADHGERLGENGNYRHQGKPDKEVIEVPWLEV